MPGSDDGTKRRIGPLAWLIAAWCVVLLWWFTMAPALVSIDHCDQVACDFRRFYYPQAVASWTGEARVVQGWYYPPTLALLLRPTLGLGVERAARWWTGVGIASLAIVAVAAAHQLRHLGPLGRWLAAGLLIVVCFPTWHALKWGQVSLPLTASILTGAHFGRSASSVGVGLAAALKIYPGFLWTSSFDRRRDVLLGLLAGALVGVLLPLAYFGPHHVLQLFTSVGALAPDVISQLAPQSLPATTTRWLAVAPPFVASAVGYASVAALVVVGRHAFVRADLHHRLAIAWCVVTLGLLPTAWHHTLVFLPWAWAVAWARAGQHAWARALVALSIVLSASTLVVIGRDPGAFQWLSEIGVGTLSGVALWVALLVAPASASAADETLPRLERRRLLVPAIASLGALMALRLLWLCDDAFISFRYADNLLAGRGLVFNAGERVEGMTNLLWTLWIALGRALGVHAEVWATGWGVALFGLTCGMLARHHLRRVEGRDDASVVPWAALGLALHPDAVVWATSGLEGSAVLLTTVAAFLLVAPALRGDRPRPIAAGLVTAVGAGMRPDAILLAPVLTIGLLVARSPLNRPSAWQWRDATTYACSVLAIWVPMNVARVTYYGDFFPNTYYAKSANLAWFSQGFVYLQTFYERHALSLLAMPLLLANPRVDADEGVTRRPEAVMALAFAGIYSLYVAKVGGDFMYARLLIPTVPFLLLALEVGIQRLPRRWAIPLGLACLLVPWVVPSPVDVEHPRNGITDERTFYADPEFEAAWLQRSRVVRRHLKSTHARVVFLGADARTMRDAGIAMAIEGETGLTDATIARQPLTVRGRPGHEKRADVHYVADQRRAHFALGERARAELGLDAVVPPVRVVLPDPSGILKDGETLWVIRWDPELMAELSRRGALVPNVAAAIERTARDAATMPPEQCKKLHAQLRRLYFDQVPSPALQEPFERHCPL